MGTWSSGIGKFAKKDPDHGKWWGKMKRWLCKIGVYKVNKCACRCKGRSAAYNDCRKEDQK